MRTVRFIVALVLFVAATTTNAAQLPQEATKPILTASTPEKVEKQPAIVEGAPNVVANEVPERDTAAPQNEDKKSEEESKPADVNEEKKEEDAVKSHIVNGTSEVHDHETEEKPSDEEIEEDADKVFYNGTKLLRVVIQSKDQKKYLRELENKGEISTWLGNGTAVDVLVKRADVINDIKQKNLVYDVIIEDLQRAIDEENPTLTQEQLDEQMGRQGYRLTWAQYHRMADIHSFLEVMTKTYPDSCSLETIGRSIEGRPLNVLKISSGQPNSPGIWVDAGIHAREWITPATATYAIKQILESDGPGGVDWYFQPLINPDGYEHSHKTDRLWRKNRANPQKGSCAGTDLNRNFGYRWGGQGASKQPCRETYAGTGPFSEPETNSINNFITGKNGQIKAYVSFHSYGQYILYPWGYDRKVPSDYADLDRVGREMATAMKKVGGQSYTVGSAASTLYPASGGSDDWAKGTAKVKYSYTIELRDTGRHGFVLPSSYIIPTAKEAYAALRTLAKEVEALKKK